MQFMQKEINSVSTLGVDQQNSIILAESSVEVPTNAQHDNLKASDSLYEAFPETSDEVLKLQ